MIKSFDVAGSSNFWSLELRAHSSEITISIAFSDVVEGESQRKARSSHTNHDELCQVPPHLVTAPTCSSSSKICSVDFFFTLKCFFLAVTGECWSLGSCSVDSFPGDSAPISWFRFSFIVAGICQGWEWLLARLLL